MELHAYSRREIEAADLSVGAPSIAICIAYPSGRMHKVSAIGSLRAVLHIRFSDCDGEGRWSFPENKDGNVALPMTRGQAVDVLDFVERWRGEASAIYCACYGGVSRSRGILAGIAVAYNLDDVDLYAKGQPNAWCKTLIVREALARKAAP